jgi:hypothetical protein
VERVSCSGTSQGDYDRSEASLIDALQVIDIAGNEAPRRGRGGIDTERYEGRSFLHEERQVWCVGRKRVVIGHSHWFMIEADTGRVVEAIYRGPR